MRIICEATGKTIYENHMTADEAKNKHYYNVLKRKVEGRRYKHRSGRPHRCRIYRCEHCEGFHLTHMPKWVLVSRKHIKEYTERKLRRAGVMQLA